MYTIFIFRLRETFLNGTRPDSVSVGRAHQAPGKGEPNAEHEQRVARRRVSGWRRERRVGGAKKGEWEVVQRREWMAQRMAESGCRREKG